MTRLPSDALLTGDSLITDPKGGALTAAKLLKMIKPENMNPGFVDPHFKAPTEENSIGEKPEVKISPHYDVEYTVEHFERMKNISPNYRDSSRNGPRMISIFDSLTIWNDYLKTGGKEIPEYRIL